MGIKRIASLLLLVVTAFGCSLYLESKYNPKVIEYRYNGELDWLTLKKLDDDFGNNSYNINLETDYTGHSLTATTGKDMYMENIKMELGEFLIEPYGNYAVIGDQVADEFFSTTAVIDKAIIISGHSYRIKGVIKDSRYIYIPFGEEISGIDWNKRVIKFVANNDDDSDILVRDFDNFLKNRDVQVMDIIVYKRKIKLYTNLSILILTYLGCSLVMFLIQKSRLSIATLWREYTSKKRRVEWRNYIKEKRKEITRNLGYLSGILFILILVHKLITRLYIPSSMIPANPFSIAVYIEIIKRYYDIFMFHLESGFSSIGIDAVKLNIMVVLMYLLTSKLTNDKSKIYRGKSVL